MHKSNLSSVCSSEGDSEAENEAEGNAGAKLTSREKLVLMEAIRAGSVPQMEASMPKKGLFALPFMQRMLKQQTVDMAHQAQEILGGEEGQQAGLAPARRVFGGQGASAAQMESPDASSSSDQEGMEPSASEDASDMSVRVGHRATDKAPAVHCGKSTVYLPSSGDALSSLHAHDLQGRATGRVFTAGSSKALQETSGGKRNRQLRSAQVAVAGGGNDGNVHAMLPTSIIQVRTSVNGAQYLGHVHNV